MIANKTSSAAPWSQGVYLVSDAARILRVPASLLRSWIVGKPSDNSRYYPAGLFESDGTGLDRHFGFHSMIELFTIVQLRKRGVSMETVRSARAELMERFDTQHPFAMRGLMTSGQRLVKTLGAEVLLELGTRGQTAFKKVLDPFLDGLDFDEANNLASRFFPLGKKSPVVVDPRHAFGRPVIEGTNLTTEAVMALLKGGETPENLAESFDISVREVLAASAFEQGRAA